MNVPLTLYLSIGDLSSLAILLAIPSTALWLAYGIFIHPRFVSIKDVPGPKRESMLWGNMQAIFADEPGRSHIRWQEEFGGAVRYHGFLGVSSSISYLASQAPKFGIGRWGRVHGVKI